MSLLSNVIKNTKKLIEDIRLDEEEKNMKMAAEKRTAKRTMKRSIDSNRKKISDIEQEISSDKALGKKYAMEGNRDLAAMQAEKVLFKTPVLQKINKVVMNQEKIYFVLDATEDIKSFNQQLVVFDKIEEINNNRDLVGVQAEKAVDNIMQELESPLMDDVTFYGEPMAENPLVTNMIDEWMGEKVQEKPTVSKPVEEPVVKPNIKEAHEEIIKEVKNREKNIGKEVGGD